MRFIDTIANGGKWVWGTLLGFVIAAGGSFYLLNQTAVLRYERDVNRMVFNDNLGVLEQVKSNLGSTADSLNRLVSGTSVTNPNKPYIVVSIADHQLWYKQGDSVLFTTQVATGSGKTLISGTGQYKFETPRGRLVVQEKDLNPAWVPPDWHFAEQANKHGWGITRMDRGSVIPAGGGSVIAVQGSEIVKRYPDGRAVPLQATEGREIVVNGNIIIPPYGTNQRRYMGVLGTRRLNLGDGYGIHGTNEPASIGHSVSHGCVRLRNEDIEKLYDMVSVGTPVYIY
jgi:lipoprotein-anchoring transpeptidase ErfK/SrfK